MVAAMQSFVDGDDNELLLLWNSTKCRDGSGDKGIDSRSPAICVKRHLCVCLLYLVYLCICVCILYSTVCIYMLVFVFSKSRVELSKVQRRDGGGDKKGVKLDNRVRLPWKDSSTAWMQFENTHFICFQWMQRFSKFNSTAWMQVENTLFTLYLRSMFSRERTTQQHDCKIFRSSTQQYESWKYLKYLKILTKWW